MKHYTSGCSPKNATAEWIGGLPNTVRKRLVRVGLIEPQEQLEVPTLADWVDRYIRSRSDIKPNTLRNMLQVQKRLICFLGTSRQLDEITPGDAEEFRIYLKGQGLSEGTIRRCCKRAKQFFTAAVKKKLFSGNPFADIKCGNYSNPERFYYISPEEAQAVLDACPDAEWRLIFALCRFGGLRCPSEVLSLQWQDIDWERSRFTVHSSKTEHHDSGGIRHVPIFPELYSHLRDCFEKADPGTKFVITRYRDTNVNLRTQLMRIIRRAGLTPWPKLFQNLRSTRETELTERHPLHVICAWIGNSQPVAAKHYLQVTEEHFRKAAQNPAQYPAALERIGLQEEIGDDGELAFCGPLRNNAAPCEHTEPLGIPPRGFEPLSPG